MAHIDCDTIPFFWRYASRFTIFDNNFATEDTPSTPNAVAVIAGQSGETQWVKHPSETQDAAQNGFTGPISGTVNGETYSGTPVRPIAAAVAFAFILASCPLAHAGPIVDRIKSSGVIRCGGVPRPGLFGQSSDGAPSGLYLDLCRAVGAALLGPEGRIEFHPYDSDKAFTRVADGADDLFFLDGSDIADHRLARAAALGPAIYFVSTAAMVHGDATIRQLSDLAGKSICFYQGDNAHLNLEASMAARRLDFVRMGYMEYGELHDAYNARICEAQVGRVGIWPPPGLRNAQRRRAAS